LKRYLGDVAQPDPEEEAVAPSTISDRGTRARLGDKYDPIREDELDQNDGFEDLGYEDEEGDEPTETIDELGRRHLRRAAPEGTEEILEKEAPRTTGLPDGVSRWVERSATGTVLAAFAFGLQQVFEPERKEPAIIMQTSGDPPKDLPVQAHLEQLGPRQSSVTVRRYLLGKGGADGAAESTEQSATTSVEQSTGEAGPDGGDQAGAQ
jgi:hypothetical protein